MLDFEFYTPTKVFFGKDAESHIGSYLKEHGFQHVLFAYGGGSIKRSGLYDKVAKELREHDIAYTELSGIEPNPKIEKVYEGMELVKKNGIDFMLAVGGGSVLDTCKAIGAGITENRDPWEIIETGEVPKRPFPTGCVLTIAAAGSEMSNSAVITNTKAHRKAGFNCDANRPAVAFMNPENTFTVSPYQTACGTVDIMMHTFERYFTKEKDCELTDRIAEGLLAAIKEAGPAALKNPCDYDARATLMWASSLSHNTLTGLGKLAGFTPHKISHELSAFDDKITHGAALAIVFPAYCKYMCQYDVQKFARMAVRVFGVPMNFEHPERTAEEGIAECERFFKSLGVPTKLSEVGIKETDIDYLANGATKGDSMTLISYIPVHKKEVAEILKLAL